ncbi:enoyl-ACP reductase FabI [Nocardiopsis terrae]
MRLLESKTIVVTGVLTRSSIAYHVARMAQAEGAEVILTGYGRLSLVRRVAKSFDRPPAVVELDVTSPEHIATLAERVGEHVDQVDGLLHSVAFAPPGALGGKFLTTDWADASTAFHTSAFSLQSVTTALLPLFRPQGSVVGLDFDATRVWSGYDWMGVAKAGLEACSRYLASYLGPRGIRSNLVASGPLRTVAATNIEDRGAAAEFAEKWDAQAPLGWDTADAEPVARACVVLLSDLLPATTGHILHVDGGAHMIGDRSAAPTSDAIRVPATRTATPNTPFTIQEEVEPTK